MLKNSWLFPVIQSVHLSGIAMLVGTIILTDLRLLGYALDHYTIEEIADKFGRWTRTGFGIMLTTGPVLFLSDVPRYATNPAFLLKMALLLLALLFHFAIHKRTTTQRHAKFVAVVSIVLWTCVVIGGRAIADFDI